MRKRRALSAKAKAKRDKQQEAKRATALAKTEATKELADKLVAQLKKIVDDAEASMVSSIREAAEVAFRLQAECGFTQLKIAVAIGRQQPWVSKILAWRERGYKGTPSIHAPDTPKLFPGNNPAAQPDPNVGMPRDGVQRTLPDDTPPDISADLRLATLGNKKARKRLLKAGYTESMDSSTNEPVFTKPASAEEQIKTGRAPSTLIHNGEAHPIKGAPMSPAPKGNGGSAPIKKPEPADKDDLVRFASLVVQLDQLTTIRPSLLVAADIDMPRLKRVTAFLEAFIAQKAEHDKRHAQAARFAAAHNETVEQHAANENVAAPAEAA